MPFTAQGQARGRSSPAFPTTPPRNLRSRKPAEDTDPAKTSEGRQKKFRIATRGSPLALAQSEWVARQLRAAFPTREFELVVVKTTGDELQSQPDPPPDLEKGLFTKELEIALSNGLADLAVHSLKDLPLSLPDGMELAAIPERADPRDVLIFRESKGTDPEPPSEWTPGYRAARPLAPGSGLGDLNPQAQVATGSPRREAQVLAARPDLRIVPIRGNVGTRLLKLLSHSGWEATILAMAGLHRLGARVHPRGFLTGPGIPSGLLATPLPPEEFVPCVGQGALAIETRAGDPVVAEVCAVLEHYNSRQCAVAERALLRAVGGGCQAAVGAYGRIRGHQIHLVGISFLSGRFRRAEGTMPVRQAVELGESVAAELL